MTDPGTGPRTSYWIALALLALGGALSIFPILDLLALIMIPVAGTMLVRCFLRLDRSRAGSGPRAWGGIACFASGTVLLAIGVWLTPVGFLDDSRTLTGTFHFTVPLRELAGSAMDETALPLPILWLAGPGLIAAGGALRGTRSAAAGRLFAQAVAVFPVCALLFLVISRFWGLGV
jgi:hypothetical protein